MSFNIFINIVKKSIPTGINRPPADTIYTIPKKKIIQSGIKISEYNYDLQSSYIQPTSQDLRYISRYECH